jgi:Flp pilus assembly protein TadD
LPHSGLGNALRGQGKTDGAIAEYKKAIELAPDNASVHVENTIIYDECCESEVVLGYDPILKTNF